MRMHVLQHVPFEGPAYIRTWAEKRGHSLSYTRLFLGETMPSFDAFDWLVVMGGPMSVNDEDRYGWLVHEKEFIGGAIEAKKIVMGVCLGAQLIAAALGGRVIRNEHKEIGFFPVRLTGEGKSSGVFSALPVLFDAFHWHGETYVLPPECTVTASSDACANQAFVYGNHVFGLQFHLEATRESAGELLKHCADELVAGEYIQSESEIRGAFVKLDALNESMAAFLEKIEATRS